MENSNMSEQIVVEKADDGDVPGQLQEQKKQLTAEFNVQRAKMKELFLQKEEDLRRVCNEKQQLESEVVGLRGQLQELTTISQNQKHELQSLQMLIHETVEASSSACSDEVRQLQARNMELEQHLQLLAKQQATQDASLAPAALVQTMTRTIARKLGGDTDDDKKVQEDSELLRPLEEEVKALKEKLRDTDNQLQVAMANKKAVKGDSKEPLACVGCDMCANYEKQLVAEQTSSEEARQRARNAERALKIATEELEGARSVHDETVCAWRTERAQASAVLEELRERMEACERNVEARAAEAERDTVLALDKVTALTVQRQTLQDKLDTLERDNAMLVGKYAKKALEMQNEDINLPDNVEELQEYALRLREELIVMSMGRESSVQAEEDIRLQLLEQTNQTHQHATRFAALRGEHQQLRQQMEKMEAERQQMNELGEKLRTSNTRLEELLNDKRRLQNEIMELRGRVSSLQQDLDNSEKVQQDFVRLSQSLQVQLERIREAETEVRWQHEDDVTECQGCRTHFPNNKRKIHCRHCGRIFCATCVCHSVASGPRGTPARVCSVCRTLLQPHSAPYFSTEPPHAPG